jgi:hypothetical protein
MRRLTAACISSFAFAFAFAPPLATVAAPASTTIPISSPPTLLGPSPFIIPQVDAPFLFQWSAVSPAQTYNVHVQGRSTVRAASLVGASYELQISDKPDVAEHVLYDTIVDQTSYLFSNDFTDGGFTTSEPPDTPLPGGRYYWRVRALFAGSTSPYSSVGAFALSSTGSGPPLHALGVVGIKLASPARVNATSLVVATVQNLGNFSETGATLEIFANGASLGTATVPPLNAAGNATFSVPWTPTDPGLADLSATLQYADDDERAHTISQTVLVLGPKSTPTALVGTLDLTLGDVTLVDDAGETVATVILAGGSTLDLTRFIGKRVRLQGNLSTAEGEFVLAATGVTLAPKAP